ncbi:MAG: DUF3046 domain-containing protein [Angustibacter sp.]
MRLSEFWRLMAEEFGPGYATSVARDQCLTSLAGRTADQALAQGVPPRTVWLALCESMQVPSSRIWGRPHRQ